MKKVNVKLFRKVQKHILAEPKRVDMDDWKQAFDDYSFLSPADRKRVKKRFPKCGTIACIAGWADILQKGGKELSVETRAEAKLHLTTNQARLVFHVFNWPENLRVKLNKVETGTKKYAQIVSDRIDLFLKEGI